MSDLAETNTSPFDRIRHETDEGGEYWSARELAEVLGYKTNYRNFKAALERDKLACMNSGQRLSDHFADARKMVDLGSGSRREVEDVELSRYACYLVMQNADPNKPIVALGQTYFAEQTRRQEFADEMAGLPAAQQRLYLRNQLSDHNKQLADAAQAAGVIQRGDFAVFQDHDRSLSKGSASGSSRDRSLRCSPTPTMPETRS
ncbi:MAG: BRO family protein [Chloroflexia bacterium]